MTESTCLHIQDHESGPIRVVELPWISVRIGRAAHCEVRLTHHDLPEEVCRLQRRGQSWRLLPGTTPSPIFLAGRRLGGSCFLPFDVPFRVGQYCFTLRRDRAAEPDWEVYAGPAPPRLDSSQKPPVAEEEPDTEEPPKATDPATRATTTPVQPATDKPPAPKLYGSSSQSSRERWETRWKALGAQIKARAESNRNSPDLKRPAYQSDLEPVPVRAPRVPSIQPASPSSIGQALASVPTPRPAKVKPVWTYARAEPVWRDRTAEQPAGSVPSEQPRQDWIARESPVQIPLSKPECIDLAHTPATQSEEPVVEEPAVLLPEEIVQDGQPEIPTATVDQPTSSADEINEREKTSSVLVSAPRPKRTARRGQRTREPIEHIGEAEPLRKSRDASSLVNEVEWPSAKDILATHRAASSSRLPATSGKKATKKKTGSIATPTLAKAPALWTPPVWLVGPAAAVFVISTGLLGCVLSWSWAHDSYMASIVTDRLLRSDRARERSPLPESAGPPEGGWMVSTAGHLAHWAIFLSRFAGEENQSPAETAALLDRALMASPINATARLALAPLEPVPNSTTVSIRSLGLSRDAVSLAWTARRLLAVGNKEDSLKLYSRALSVAIPGESSRSPVPRFSEDSGVRRYLLPGEEQVRDIVVDLVSQNAWTFQEWSSALPENPIVLIATARLLRERGRNETETVLDRILKVTVSADAPEQAGPVALAARAEAFALRSNWREAGQLYRQAIDSINDPTIARSWWFNLADISYRSDDEIERQVALRAASAVASSDDITRRATEIQRATPTRSNGVKAN